ncbi:MAG: CPBP family intramembrane metalloprotease [Kiritimatiellae bacterium]|nr:CPBP family intramembrane metalloprotease [Kiritimatiellia bacterium]MCO5068431.1 CPBP family intramembrane metalloprotease [Kiritimatiellia bacterium]
MLILAQVEAIQATPLESELMQRAGAIGLFYLVLTLAGFAVLGGLAARWRRQPPPLRVALARLLDRPWHAADVWRLLAILAMGFACVFLLQQPWTALMARVGISQESGLLFLQSLLFHVVGLSAVAFHLAKQRRTWRDAFGFSGARLPVDLAKGLFALLASIPALLGITFLFHLVLNLLGHQPSLQDVALAIADEPNRWAKIYFVFLAVCLAPLFEELLFRGIILPVVARRFGAWAGLLLTSFLFAAIHGHLPSFGTLFAFAFALGSAYILTGSLAVAIVMHACFNGITVAILLAMP